MSQLRSHVIALGEAVKRIHDDQQGVAAAPGACFFYSTTRVRVAGRMAEVATGKSWSQIFDEQLRVPMGFSAESSHSGGSPNPGLAGGLKCTGTEDMRFLRVPLRRGLDGTRRVLPESLIESQWQDS
jgi:CubicO group peptidase (beta-lactamase class C family)